MKDGSAVLIPGGIRHNIITGKDGLKVYTIYSPPEHKKNTVEKFKMD